METPQEEAVYPLSPALADSIHMIHGRRRKIRIRLWKKNRLILWGLLFSLLAVSLLTFSTMDYGDVVLLEAISQFFSDIQRIFLQPHLSGRFSLKTLIEALGVTIGLSVVTTLLGALVAFFFSLLAACNLSSKRLSTGIRVVMSFVRAVPTILWVMIFSIIIGLGSNAAVIGMLFHSVAYLTKVYSESIEEMDYGTIEALKASGATWWQIVFQVVLPSCITAILSWTFIRFEINFTNAIAVGAAAGAGGLGFQLAMASGFYFDLHEIGVMVYMILLVAAVLELISMKLRSNYIVKN
ncbi:phosphonate transport system permease [Enterococcus sp. AZ196]|uniref:ABC transporter permease subunit n=2 Tax=Enterococcus TaxID=1350 RepID=A0ABS3HJ56_9ENTE|nr:ABC transporter permease subunit [Enterococcus sp. MJM16]MBO0453502.1 ABC transporter permease subunit [Enterococcus sp. MJM16]